MDSAADLSHIDLTLDSRAITAENPTGGRGIGGQSRGGRKGSPSQRVGPGERAVLADIGGPGTVRHLWLTFPPAPPEQMRAVVLEVTYDNCDQPSVSVPVLDFFGLPHGRPVPYASALVTAQEGRGFNSYLPMPFGERIRIEVLNGATRPIELYHQVDLTLEPARSSTTSYLHASFRRENPTTLARDFTIADGLRGPGRFAGCVVGIRLLDTGMWYGEGEVKVFLDGDGDHPTICGTGLEDYVGSAWGLGPHHAPYAGAPLEVRAPGSATPELVGFYRWHLPDPVVFRQSLRVTIQQIGAALFGADEDQRAAFKRYAASHPSAGRGWFRDVSPTVGAFGLVERVDDYCATAFVYCAEPQPVPVVDVAAAVAGIERRPYERPNPMEALLGGMA